MKINFIDLQRQYQNYKEEINQQIQEVLDNATFIMGDKIKELEEKLAAFVKIKFAISCASGTDALLLALLGYNISKDDEIITTPFTFVATAEVIAFLGAKPVFVDIREDTYNIDSKRIRQAITKKTRGIIAVDLFGQCADYDDINTIAKTNGLFVIEDGAQSLGAEYKGKKACSLAEVGCTSFFPAKSLGCYGDGGMIFTNDEEKAKIFMSLRTHGAGDSKYDHVRIGLNCRMDTLQAAIVLAKFNHFSQEIKMRQEVAQYYTERLEKYAAVPTILAHNLSVFCQYCIRVQDRAGLQKKLSESKIPTAIHYPKPLHLQGAFSYLGYQKGDYPVSEKTSQEILALPMHPFLRREEQNFIIDMIGAYYKY